MPYSRISVIVPVLNGQSTLQACLDAIFAQTLMPYEVIVVDNNSTDKTKEIITQMQTSQPTLKYVFEKMQTRGAARNAGINASTGNIIAMTDVDCLAPTDWLEKLTQPIRDGAEKVVVGGQYDLVHTYWSKHMQKLHEFLAMRLSNVQGYIKFIDTKNFAIESIVIKSTMFDPLFKAVEDEDFSFRLRPYVFFRYLPTIKVGHRHAQGMISTLKASFERSFWSMQMYHKYKGLVDMNGRLMMPIIPLWAFLRSLVYFDIPALRAQGLLHLPFFIVYDVVWKFGRVAGYFNPNKDIMARRPVEIPRYQQR